MIDLAQDRLPDALLVGGERVPVLTGFRAWLTFGRAAEAGYAWPGVLADPAGAPDGWLRPALEFFESRNPCPHGGKGGGARTMDLLEDGDYVVAAFQQAYGIDLTDPALDMHWHRFLALLRGLPGDTKLAEIAGYRSWSEADEKRGHKDACRALRDAWALPTKADEAAVDAQQDEFGAVVEKYAREMGMGPDSASHGVSGGD